MKNSARGQNRTPVERALVEEGAKREWSEDSEASLKELQQGLQPVDVWVEHHPPLDVAYGRFGSFLSRLYLDPPERQI
jgi:hypothetical protein